MAGVPVHLQEREHLVLLVKLLDNLVLLQLDVEFVVDRDLAFGRLPRLFALYRDQALHLGVRLGDAGNVGLGKYALRLSRQLLCRDAAGLRVGRLLRRGGLQGQVDGLEFLDACDDAGLREVAFLLVVGLEHLLAHVYLFNTLADFLEVREGLKHLHNRFQPVQLHRL